MPSHAVHPDNHRDHKNGGDQKQHALESVLADFPALQRDGDSQAGRHSGKDAAPHPAHEIRAPSAIQIDEYDADDKRGFDAFPKSDEKSREQTQSLSATWPATRFASMDQTAEGRHAEPCTSEHSREGQA